MKLGVDLSTLNEFEKQNPVFTYHGKKVDPYNFFSYHSNIKSLRLRIWHDPYDEEGNPYGGGTNDLKATIKMALRAKEVGMSILLDFHYSDFYVDPSRQRVPKAWEDKNYHQIIEELSNYTKETLLALKEHDIDVFAVQIGNEITNGMLFPFGKLDVEYSEENGGGFQGLATLLKTGRNAVKEVYPNAKIVVHLENSGNNDVQDWYFANLTKYFNDFDVIGESYYPYWHGGLPRLFDNVKKLKAKYHKEIWLVEMGYEYAESLVPGHHCEYANRTEEEFQPLNPDGRIPYPITKEGQVEYLKRLLKLCVDNGVEYAFYWEPCWILLPDSGWAKPAGQIYCGLEPTIADNDWANETLFDFNGEATPAVEVFTQQYVDSLK